MEDLESLSREVIEKLKEAVASAPAVNGREIKPRQEDKRTRERGDKGNGSIAFPLVSPFPCHRPGSEDRLRLSSKSQANAEAEEMPQIGVSGNMIAELQPQPHAILEPVAHAAAEIPRVRHARTKQQ